MTTMAEYWKTETYTPMDADCDEASRAWGFSMWHWVFHLNGASYGFYNTKAQALAARERMANEGRSGK